MDPSQLGSLQQATHHLVLLPGDLSEFIWYTAVSSIQPLVHVDLKAVCLYSLD